MSRWIHELQGFSRLTVYLIQCDLARHSKWFARCVDNALGPRAARAKKQLGETLLESLVTTSFDVVFWRGDGGLYAAREDVSIRGDDVVAAALAVREAFLRWRGTPSLNDLDLSQLGLRLSIHQCQVWVDSDTGYWTSVPLNAFLKYERSISHESTVAITHAVFEDLEKARTRFLANVKRVVFEPDLHEAPWRIYYDAAVADTESARNTLQWFRQHFAVDVDAAIGAESQRFRLGDAVILKLANSPEDPLDIELSRQEPSGFVELKALVGPEITKAWAVNEREIRDEIRAERDGVSEGKDPRKLVDRVKACAVSLRLPLKDFPFAQIGYEEVLFSTARSFLNVLSLEQARVWELLASKGSDYVQEAPRRPGLFAVHVVLLTGDDPPHLVLAQRSRRVGDKVGLLGALWSASMEEQFEPSDVTLEGTIRRGLQEELLGSHAQDISAGIFALCLNRPYLNLDAYAVCRTPLSFREVHDAWMTPVIDHDEHTQVVALPLDKALIQDCARAGRLVDAARHKIMRQTAFDLVWNSTTVWDLHPTSAFRLALAVWLKEETT